MKLLNRTDLDSAQLGAIIREAASREILSAEDVARLKVNASYRRKSRRYTDEHPSVRASRDKWSFDLGFVKGVTVDRTALAASLAWALTVNQGAKARWHEDGWREKCGWAEQMPLEERAVEEKEPVAADVEVAKKMEHCLEQIVAWEQKEKLARTKLRRWESKLAYYTRKLRKVVG